MLRSDVEEAELSLSRIRRMSKVVNSTLKAASLLLLIFLVVTVVLSVASSAGLLNVGLGTRVLDLIVLSVYALVIIGLVYTVANVFADVVKGESPFTLAQGKRFRIIAVLLLVYVFLDAAMSTGTVAQIHIGDLELGYDVVDKSTLSVNVGALFGAGFFWALSRIFEYGVLLQELSDETL